MCPKSIACQDEAQIRRSMRTGVSGAAPMRPLRDYVITTITPDTDADILEPVGDWGLTAFPVFSVPKT